MRVAAVVILPALLAACQGSDAPDDDMTPVRTLEVPRVASADEALSGVHLPTIDPAGLNEAEIMAVLGSKPYCVFRYARDGRPVLALTLVAAHSPAGVVKLNNFLIPLTGRPGGKGVREATAGNARMKLISSAKGDRKVDESVSAELNFEIDGAMRAGFAGYSDCPV